MGLIDKAIAGGVVAVVGGVVALAGAGVKMLVAASREEKRRRETPPQFDERLSQEDFITMVQTLAKRTPRVEVAKIDGLVVKIYVRSNTGLSMWSAVVDFNDYGRATGHHWISSQNDQSPIPKFFAEQLREQILQRLADDA